MKKVFGMVLFCWLTSTATTVSACDAHPGVDHEKWAKWLEETNAKNSNKSNSEAMSPADSKRKTADDEGRRTRTQEPGVVRIGR